MKKTQTCFSTGLVSLCVAVFLSGCSRFVLLDPKGPVGADERFVILVAIALMLLVVIPVIVMVLVFPMKYRASNARSVYRPTWSRSVRIEVVIWLVPAVIVAIISSLIWIKTHQLDPYKPIEAQATPVTIQVVSLDWKWLFIYPEQKIATVNQLVFPVNVPLSFRLTSDTVMTSFFIPQLGSQIYAMAGMQTRLHLLADKPGTFLGQNQQFSGRGYADMNFKATAVSPEGFQTWVRRVRQSSVKLDQDRYEQVAKPSVGAPVAYFSSVAAGLFEDILHQYDVHSKTVKNEAGAEHSKTDFSGEN